MSRAIRLKEFPRSVEIINTPPEWYVEARDSSLIRQDYKIQTDENGFIKSDPDNNLDAPRLVFLGDSAIEGMYVIPEARMCSKLQSILKKEYGVEVRVLNGGYSGATALHSFNTFINKVIPLRPAAVILMTGMIDASVALKQASFWSQDCWIEPIIDLRRVNTWRDNNERNSPSFDDQIKLLMIFSAASRIFETPLWLATVPHRQLYHGEYVAKAFKGHAEFAREVDQRRAVNDVTRRTAIKQQLPFFDLELDLVERTDIFYDMFHLNSIGGEVVARSLIKLGFVGQIATVFSRPDCKP